jgi:hypothetical protein
MAARESAIRMPTPQTSKLNPSVCFGHQQVTNRDETRRARVQALRMWCAALLGRNALLRACRGPRLIAKTRAWLPRHFRPLPAVALMLVTFSRTAIPAQAIASNAPIDSSFPS